MFHFVPSHQGWSKWMFLFFLLVLHSSVKSLSTPGKRKMNRNEFLFIQRHHLKNDNLQDEKIKKHLHMLIKSDSSLLRLTTLGHPHCHTDRNREYQSSAPILQ